MIPSSYESFTSEEPCKDGPGQYDYASSDQSDLVLGLNRLEILSDSQPMTPPDRESCESEGPCKDGASSYDYANSDQSDLV